MTIPAVPTPGPDTPTWTATDSGALLYGPEGEFHAYSDMLGLVGGLGAPESEAFAALVADVRAARAHEHCGPATDTLQQARELAAQIKVWKKLYGRIPDPECELLLDLLVDGGTDG